MNIALTNKVLVINDSREQSVVVAECASRSIGQLLRTVHGRKDPKDH